MQKNENINRYIIVFATINIHPHSGWYFIFGHSPILYWLRTSAFFIGLPATHLLLATHKWVVINRLPCAKGAVKRSETEGLYYYFSFLIS